MEQIWMDEKKKNAEELLDCAMAIGEGLLVSGAEVSRVEDTIRRLCKAFGANRVDVFTITSSIVVTISGPEFGILTQTRRVEGMAYDLTRVEHLNQLSRKICNEKKSLSAKEIQEELQKMEEEKEDSFRKDAILYGVISASFSVFFGGSFLDAIASFLIGILLKCLQTWFGKMCINSILSVFLCSVLGGISAHVLVNFGLGHSVDLISIGNIMLLIPGIALTNGIRDMFSGDLISGLLRFMEALLLAVVIAFAFVLSSLIF